ncbi:MAG: hypothetical protein KKC39_00185 [Candidatus Omnitrophica bacterium]|nr:hypothetical protein [Patescibacteria group bacterium]MBU4467151.1 hypothetical protein [Candidatus Omnitrophota bacterium]MCG2707332.1 hypothetical protein [Candidatus Omnitrophota bacterium]
MFDSNVVKISLFFYIILAGLALFLLWRNSAAPDALKNAGILLASILPVLIVVLPYFKQEIITRQYSFALFYDSENKQIVVGDKFNPYYSNYMYMFTNLSKIPNALDAKDFSEVMDKKGIDIVEKGIVDTLIGKFMMHWDIETKKFEGPVGRSESWSGASKLHKETIPISEIQKIFKSNPFIATPGIIVHPNTSVPPKTSITVKTDNRCRAIVFVNPFAVMEIDIAPSSGMVAQHGIWGAIIADPKNMNRYYVIEYKITANLKLNKTKVYSPEMKYYRKWFENVCDVLERFDWSTVDKNIEKTLNREAISKILGIDNP